MIDTCVLSACSHVPNRLDLLIRGVAHCSPADAPSAAGGSDYGSVRLGAAFVAGATAPPGASAGTCATVGQTAAEESAGLQC